MNPIIQSVKDKDPDQREFHQAVTEVIETIQPVMDQNPEYRSAKILERLVEPERVVIFRVPWVDDQEIVDILAEAISVRNGWKRILERCSPPTRKRNSVRLSHL